MYTISTNFKTAYSTSPIDNLSYIILTLSMIKQPSMTSKKNSNTHWGGFPDRV